MGGGAGGSAAEGALPAVRAAVEGEAALGGGAGAAGGAAALALGGGTAPALTGGAAAPARLRDSAVVDESLFGVAPVGLVCEAARSTGGSRAASVGAGDPGASMTGSALPLPPKLLSHHWLVTVLAKIDLNCAPTAAPARAMASTLAVTAQPQATMRAVTAAIAAHLLISLRRRTRTVISDGNAGRLAAAARRSSRSSHACISAGRRSRSKSSPARSAFHCRRLRPLGREGVRRRVRALRAVCS